MSFLRRSLWIGAGVDLALAPLALIPIQPVAAALGIPIGTPVMHIRFAGLLLLLLPLFYVVGARDARVSVPIGGVAVLARAAGVLFIGAHVVTGQAAPAYGLFIVIDGMMGVLHTMGLRRAGHTLSSALSTRVN